MGAGAVSSPERQSGGGRPEVRRPRERRSSIIHPNGFTLIELLVVIAVISLLMALLMPALSRARKQARAILCQSRLKQWGTILALYAQDNEGHFPCNGGGDAGEWLLRGALLNVNNKDANVPQDSFFHFRTRDIACCPVATRYIPDNRDSSFPISLPTALNVGQGSIQLGTLDLSYPAWVINVPAPRCVGSYGLNRFLFRPHFESTLTFVPPAELTHGADIFSLAGKANIPVVLDSAAPSGGPPSADDGPPSPSDGTFSKLAWPFCLSRHDGLVNGVFLDWSVRKIGLKELWKLKWFRDFDTNGPWTRAGGVKPEDWPLWMRGLRDY